MLSLYSRIVTRHPLLVLLGVAIVVAAATWRVVDFRALADGRPTEALRLVIDPSQDSMLPTEDEGRRFYDRIRRIFGNDETLLVVALAPKTVYETRFLAALKRATEGIERAEGVRSVTSLANAANVRASGGDLEVGPFYEEPPQSVEELTALRSDLAENRLLATSLVSADERGASIVVYLRDMSEAEFTARGIDRTIKQLAREEFGDSAEVLLTGSSHVKAETSRTIASDLLRVIPAVSVLLIVVGFLSFRTLRGVLLPLVSIGIALIVMLGYAAVFQPNLNVVTAMIPALILVVGFAYTVHLVSCYYEALREPAAGQAASAAQRALERVILPTVLTGITTAAGFAALATNPISAIRVFGMLAAVGVVCAMLTTLTFAPAMLQLLPEKLPRRREGAGRPLIDRLLEALARFDVQQRRWVLGASALVAMFALAGVPRIEVSTNLVEGFAKGSEVRRSIELVNEVAGASDQIYVVLEAPYKNAFKETANLEALSSLQQWLGAQPEVAGTSSLVDHLRLINKGFHDGDPSFDRIPDNSRTISQLLFFGASDATKRVIDSQYQIASITLRINVFDSGEVVALARRIEERFEDLPDHLSAVVTGNTVLLARTSDEIALGQALSLGTAFLIILAILTLLFTSVRVGFLAMLPNVFPVLIYFGTLGWTGIPLNVTTGLVACLVLGIAVDDTIHFLTRFNAAAKGKADEAAGVREALLEVGRAVTYTSAALCAGFVVVGFSDFGHQAQFGLLAAFTLGIAWVVDLTLTPSLAAGMRIVTLWDALAVDLGERPQQAIPLLRGLSNAQARIAALMTELTDFPAGHRLMETGAASDGMYVVIEGELRSSVEREGQTVPLNVHGRGDVIGEVGLLRGERTANVDCETAVRALRLDPANLARLRRRYPRIGAQVFQNLSEILAHRLATLTDRVR